MGAQGCTAVCGWHWGLPGLMGVSRGVFAESVERTVQEAVGDSGRTGDTSELPTNLLTAWMHPPRKYK